METITKNHAILSDIDLSLLPSTSTDILKWQQDLILNLEAKLSGALAMITGRGIESVDKVFPGVAASVEQHAAWREQRGEKLKALGSQVNIDAIVESAAKELNGKVKIVSKLSSLSTVKDCVFIEKKQFSLALIFSQSSDLETIDIIKRAARKIIRDDEALSKTHEIKVGSDSIEIGPSGIDKGTAVKDFMNSAKFRGRIPIYIGDGPTDIAAMEVVKQMGGINVAVSSIIQGDELVDIRVNTIEEAWDLLKKWDSQLTPV